MIHKKLSSPATHPSQVTIRQSWRYTETSKRDLRLDFLRGFAILVLIVDHVVVADSWFYRISGNAEFIISAAELFYAISGVVIGIVASRQAEAVAIRRSLRRAWELYLAAISIALFFLAVAWLTDLRMWDHAWRDLDVSLNSYVFTARSLQVLTLESGFNGSEILIQYVVYMLLAPLAILACADGKAWLVILSALLVYAISWLNPSATVTSIASAFSLHRWQPLFFIGLVIGYHRSELSRWVVNRRWHYALAAGVGIVALFFVGLHIAGYPLWPDLPERLGNRYDMHPLRLVLVSVYLFASYSLVTWLWRPLNALCGRLLIRLGQEALWCFSIHFVVILLLYNLPFFRSDVSIWLGTLWHGIAIALVFASLYVRDAVLMLWPSLKEKYKQIMLAAPAILAWMAVQFAGWLGIGASYVEVIDDGDPRCVWQGWNEVADQSAYGGSMRVTDKAGAAMQCALQGKGIELYGRISRSGGRIEVLVDQQSYGEYGLQYSGPDTYRVRLFVVRDLTPGEHELSIISRTSDEVAIDYLRIAP